MISDVPVVPRVTTLLIVTGPNSGPRFAKGLPNFGEPACLSFALISEWWTGGPSLLQLVTPPFHGLLQN